MVKVVIAEDDLLIADLLEDVLVGAGFEVCGMAASVGEAIDLCNQRHPDLAVIDMRLADGGRGTEIVAGLEDHTGLGVLYATGNAGHTGLIASDGDACITKPYQAADIVRALHLVRELVETGKTTKPFPRNFELLRQGEAPESNSHATRN
jgi:CheY-like chemotaxis protein